MAWKWVGYNYGGDAFWDKDGLEGRLVDSDGNNVLEGMTTEGDDSRVSVSSAANACLIEAAPELLAVLKDIRATADWDKVEAIIAKAEGNFVRVGPENPAAVAIADAWMRR